MFVNIYIGRDMYLRQKNPKEKEQSTQNVILIFDLSS